MAWQGEAFSLFFLVEAGDNIYIFIHCTLLFIGLARYRSRRLRFLIIIAHDAYVGSTVSTVTQYDDKSRDLTRRDGRLIRGRRVGPFP